MASLADIKQKIAGLSRDELAELRAWFADFNTMASEAIQAQVNAQQRLLRLKGKVRWEGNLEEMRRD